MKPTVSIIMPVFDAASFLDQSIGSVVTQSFEEFELICFNDASTDNSLEILRRYECSDRRVKVTDSPVNVKQGGGRNRALAQATGRYVMFLDADDALVPDALEKCVNAAESLAADLVIFDYLKFAPTTASRVPVSQLGEDAAGLCGDDLRTRIIERATPVWSAMYERRLIVDNDLYFPEGVFYEDNAVALAIQLSARNPVKINNYLYIYRTDNQSVTRSADNYRFFDRLGSAVMLLNNLNRLGIYERFREGLDFVFFNQYLVHTVFGCIYRFNRVPMTRLRYVVKTVRRYIPDYHTNRYYRRWPMAMKLKLATHIRFPRVIKLLSDISRRLTHLRRQAGKTDRGCPTRDQCRRPR